MTRRPGTRTIVIGAVAALAVAGGAAAVAATQLGPKAESQQIVSDAAKELGVTPAELTKALTDAMAARVDAAVAAGQLTKERGDAFKAHMTSGELPLFGAPGRGPGERSGFGHRGGASTLEGAAAYLGISEAALREQLVGGESLADIAKSKGKTVDGLVSALVTEATKKVDAAVAAGRLTDEQGAAIENSLKQRITDRVNGVRPEWGGGHGFGHHHGDGGARAATPASFAGSGI